MSFNLSSVKWGWVVIGAVIAVVIAVVLSLIVQFGYGLIVGFQLRGAPPQEMLMEAFASTPFLIVGIVITAIGAVVGGRIAGRRSEDNPQLAGLIAGILMAVILLALGAWQGGLDPWTAPNVVIAVAGGWLGGWLVSKRSQTDF
jgi:putative membrane protein (TIGR04086 family)